MSRLPGLHRQLVRAAREQDAQERELGRLRAPARRLLVALALAGMVLASTAIALAASGVIPIGSTVPPDRHLRAAVGIGLPEPGGSRLLPLRVSDPEGGPPWGMRMIRTSRDEVCLQIGRVEDGKLGVLGVDGAFGDDGELHPLPLDALPTPVDTDVHDSFLSTTTSCFIAGQAFSSSRIAMRISAAGERTPSRPTSPDKDLRDVYFGVLGPQAVSVSYRDGGARQTSDVADGTGAYLIVLPYSPEDLKYGFGGASGGPLGQLAPGGSSEPIDRITYRLHGRLCERGPIDASVRPAHPCPAVPGPSPTELAQLRERRDLHRPVHVHLRIHDGLVTAADVSFKAPYAISSARHFYSVFLPQPECHPRPGVPHMEGGGLIPIDHDVAAGQIVSARVTYPFAPVRPECVPGRLAIQVDYESAERSPRTIVGEATVSQPPGTRGGPHAKPLR